MCPNRIAAPQRNGLALLWLCAGVLYSLWLLGPWINPALDELDGYVSEFAARDQPGATLFRAGDALAGLGVLASVLARPRLVVCRWEWAGWAGVALFGLATVIDAVLTPMDCAAYVDSGCAAREVVGALSLSHDLHAGTSGLAGAGAVLGMLGLGLGARLNPLLGLPPRWLLALCGVTAVASTATIFALLAGSWAGVAQRVQLLCIAVWLISSAVCWLRPGGDRDAGPAPQRAGAGARGGER